MKKQIIFTVIFIIFASALYGQSVAAVSYVDGWVDIKDSSGKVFEAYIGDDLFPGNSVITGKGSYAELLEKSGSTYKVSPNTVFTVREMESNGKKESVLAVTIGEVAFKFNKVAGTESMIATHSTVAGVRGTEFIVYSGSDGSSLIAVTQGLVEVEASGKSVSLNPDEAVEVKPGSPPGPKIQLLGRSLDFSKWNEDKKQDFLNNPVEALKAVDMRLDYYNAKVQEIYPVFLEMLENVYKAKAELNRIYKEQGEAASAKYDDTVFRPLTLNAAYTSLNLRYYALSALSMRRYIVGNMYAEIKSRYITKLNDPVFIEFNSLYKEVLKKFEEISIPQINETDI
ncbi:MAG: FecR domain-containing protein [Spirochaetaceae bacterium]|nr:FecR domain-containing protein [Spirochaetaceae bacterium]